MNTLEEWMRIKGYENISLTNDQLQRLVGKYEAEYFLSRNRKFVKLIFKGKHVEEYIRDKSS